MKSLAILSYILVFVTILWFLYIGNYLSLSTKDKTKINIPFFYSDGHFRILDFLLLLFWLISEVDIAKSSI
jgi:hypothetical protein